MARNDEEDDNRSWEPLASGNTVVPTTVEDARKQYEKALQGGGLQSLSLQTDKKGNSQILGFKIPKELLPAVETVLPNAITWLQRAGSQFSYDKSKWLAEKAKFKNAKAEAIAKAAEFGVRWGLIGIKPIADAIYNTKTYARQRRELFREFAPVIQSTGVNYKTNEVIRNAFDELHDDMVSNMKLLAADALTLAPMIYVGVKDQRAANKKKLENNAVDTINKNVGEKVDARIKRIEEQNEFQELLDGKLDAARKSFIEKRRGMVKNGITLDDKALGALFDENANDAAYYIKLEHEEAIRAKSRKDQPSHGEEKKSDFSGEQLSILGLSLGSQIIKTNIREASERRRKSINAWKMIQHLDDEIEAQASRQNEDGYSTHSADDVRINTKNGQLKLRDYIIEIFQQHERDRMARLSKDNIEERQKINPLGPALVEQLIPTVDMLAEYIADGRLSPSALVNLVGDNQIVVHKPNGARRFADAKDVEKILDDLLSTMGTHEKIKEEEFFANFADPALIQGTLKKNLQTMQGKEKAFFVALFPDSILEQAGMKKKEIVEQRKNAHSHLQDIMTASALVISEYDPETLKKIGLSEKEISAVKSLVEKVHDGDEQAMKVAIEGRDKTVLSAIRTAGLNAQAKNVGDGAKFWANMIEKAKSVPELIAERKKQREEAPAAESGNEITHDPQDRLADAEETHRHRHQQKHRGGKHQEQGGDMPFASAREREDKRRDAEPSEGITA